MKHQLVLALTALAFSAPLAARAQDVPSYADGGYQNSADEQIRGRIVNFDGAYALAVRDDRGFVDNVELHQGTIINPTGLTLEPGMVVSVLGYNSGAYLDANEIDTPYTYADGGVPYYSGHPWNYYGPTIGLSFFFGGGGGWWHGGGGYDYPRYAYSGGRFEDRVNNVHVENVYRGNGYGGNYRGSNHGGNAGGYRNVNAGGYGNAAGRGFDSTYGGGNAYGNRNGNASRYGGARQNRGSFGGPQQNRGGGVHDGGEHADRGAHHH